MTTFLEFREDKLGGGAVEIGVRQNGELLAVITHPCRGADWFFHPAGFTPRQRFKTKKAAWEAPQLRYEVLDENDENFVCPAARL